MKSPKKMISQKKMKSKNFRTQSMSVSDIVTIKVMSGSDNVRAPPKKSNLIKNEISNKIKSQEK